MDVKPLRDVVVVPQTPRAVADEADEDGVGAGIVAVLG